MSDHDAFARYRASRRALAAQHDDGAELALSEYVEAEVSCGSYCQGGSPVIDCEETLAMLAEHGWRLVRAWP